MKLKRLFLAGSSLALISASPYASAEHTWETQSMGSFTFSANVALTSDYVWRYVSQSDEKGAIQGGFDLAHSTGLYAGTWGSNVDFNDGGDNDASLGDPSMELDLYGGFAHEFGNGIGIDVGLINYRYPGQSDFDWVEYYGGLSYTVFGIGLSGSVNYSNDVFNTSEDGTYYTAAAEYSFATKYPITISGDFGYYDFDKKVGFAEDKYYGWRLGAALDVHGFVFDVSYHDTDSDGETIFGDWADNRVVATISKSF